MEHSALHGLILLGVLVSLAGPLLVLCFVPRITDNDDASGAAIVRAIERRAGRLVFWGAIVASAATALNMVVDLAELHGQTVFGGADFEELPRFALETSVGQLSLWRILLLACAAVAASRTWRGSWHAILAFAVGASFVTSVVSHAGASPLNRAPAIAIQFLHIAAAAGWIGVLLHLFAARGMMLNDPSVFHAEVFRDVVRRFSPTALAVTSLLAITGILAACRFVHGWTTLLGSAYGLTLLVKLGLIAPALLAGYINFRFVRPELDAAAAGDAPPAPALQRFARTLELEIVAGILVIVVAGVLGSVSPPGEEGAYCLTGAQKSALLMPHWPTVVSLATMTSDNSPTITIEDLRYSEFTHNWSGLMVCALGLGWMGLAAGGTINRWSTALLPVLLALFGCFIAIAANPELWWLRQISPLQAIRDPQILEHQIGAIIVFILAWLSWRDRKNQERNRPLGYPLPILMIAGSLLLLGHAHSTVSAPDELTNLINVQHAVFGAFGIFAGMLRLLMLRGICPAAPAKYLWPGLVLGLGLFMAFFYREVA